MENKKELTTLLPENIDKLNKLLNCIEHIKTESESIYIKFKKDLILQTNEHLVIHSNNGQIAIKGDLLHLNPRTNINKYFDSQQYTPMISKLEEENKKELERRLKELKNESKTCDC